MSLTRREFTSATGAAGFGLFGAAALGSGLSAPAHADYPESKDPSVLKFLEQDPSIRYLGHPVNSKIGSRNPVTGQEDGRWVQYQVFKGESNSEEPGTFVVTDIESGQVLRAITMPTSECTRDLVVATDGRVYLPTYYDYRIWRYDPTDKSLVDLGEINSDAERDDVFGAGFGPDGRTYFGSYAKSRLHTVDPATGTITTLGTVNPEEDYIHYICWDPGTNAIFCVTGGQKVSVWRIEDAGFGAKTKLIDGSVIPGFDDTPFLGCLDCVEGHLVIRFGDRLIVTDTDGNIEYFPDIREMSGYHVVPLRDGSGFVFSSHGALKKYDFATASHTTLNGEVRSYIAHAVEVEDGVIMGSDEGGPFTVNYLTGERTEHAVAYNQPTLVQKIFKGPDDALYASGYMKGLAEVNKGGGEPNFTVNEGQYESCAVRNGLMYLGAYGHSKLYSYDPADPESNPTLLYSGADHHFDRPNAIAYNPERDEIYLGAVPGYGRYQGGISIYDAASGDVVFLGAEITEDQGVISMAYNPHDKLLYLGTTIDGGMGTNPTSVTMEGQIVVFDPASREVVDRFVPVAGREGVTGMLCAPDGSIWAVAEEQLMRLDTGTGEVATYGAVSRKYSAPPTYTWSWAYLSWSRRDQMIYGAAYGNFFRADPATGEWTMIADGGASLANTDDSGDVYFANRTNMFVYLVPFSPQGEPTDATKLAAVLDFEAGRSIRFPADYPQRWRRIYEVIERQVADGQAERLKQIYGS